MSRWPTRPPQGQEENGPAGHQQQRRRPVQPLTGELRQRQACGEEHATAGAQSTGGGVAGAAAGGADHRAEQKGAESRERCDAEEDPTPADRCRHRARECGAHQRGQHPRAGHDREHPTPTCLREDPSHEHIDGHDESARAEALKSPAQEKHLHVRGEAIDGQAGPEQGEPPDERGGGAMSVDASTRVDQADDVGE
jgi:hypothetical protein